LTSRTPVHAVEEREIFAWFRIIRLLGSGGMGEVYLVQHPRLPRRSALIVLPADVSADPEYRARFNREADLASTLWHPNIVAVLDRGEFDGQLRISMDYVDRADTAHLLRTRYRPDCRATRLSRFSTQSQKPWITPTNAVYCTATSSLPTSCSLPRAKANSESCWPTSE
jgi:serine/threonine protein kinase